MPNLGDYLGQLIGELTIARVQADLEALRVAEMYLSHPILRSLPVPRLRLPEVRLDVPVVIREMEEPPIDESARGGAPLGEMRRRFDEILSDHLEKTNWRLSRQQMRQLNALLDARVEALSEPREIAVDLRRVADDFATETYRWLTAPGRPAAGLDPDEAAGREQDLRRTAWSAFFRLRKPPPRLSVLVTTAEVREAGPTDILTRLQLRLTEDGVEWTSIESEGRMQQRLVPE